MVGGKPAPGAVLSPRRHRTNDYPAKAGGEKVRVQVFESTAAVAEALHSMLQTCCPKIRWNIWVEESDDVGISGTVDLNGHVKTWYWHYEPAFPVSVKMLRLQAERIASEIIADVAWWLREDGGMAPDDTGFV
mgnify:CR=1 FL=1